MPGSEAENHPFVQALGETIAALTYLRESGVKTLPVEPEVWTTSVGSGAFHSLTKASTSVRKDSGVVIRGTRAGRRRCTAATTHY